LKSQRRALFLVLLRNGILEYVRDPVANMFSFAMPLVFFAIFAITGAVTGMSGTSSGARTWTIGVVDEAGTPESARLIASLDALSGLVLERMKREESDKSFSTSRVQAVIFIPKGWRGLESGKVEVLTKTYAQRAMTDAFVFAEAQMQSPPPTVELQPRLARIVEGPPEENPYFNYLMTGLVGFSLLQLGLYGTASPILASKRQGLFRHYSLTPIPLDVLAASHVSVRVVMAMFQVALMVGASMALLGLELRSGVGMLLVVSAASAAALITMGYLIGGAFKRTQVGMILVLGLNFYLMLFGQLFTDFRNVPVLKYVILATPLTYVTDAFRHVFLGPVGQLFSVWTDVAVLLAWTLMLFLLSLRTFTFQAKPQ
jgi:ABC-2 type transport system permease protein